MVEWVKLFQELIRKKVSFVFLRVLLFIYQEQSCDVSWNGRFSYKFRVKNGVGQGAVSSPILFGLYIDKLIKLLRQSGIGCKIGTYYYGVLVYADDIILLCPSRMGLQAMIKVCEKFAGENNLKFSTNVDPKKSKTKCIIFSRKPVDSRKVSPIVLNHDPLPWVPNVNHLGNVLQCDNKMSIDLAWQKKES